MDRELRERFARLRDEERASAGAYRVPARGLAGRRPNADRRRYRLAATIAAAAAIVAAVLALPDRQAPAAPEAPARATASDFPVAMEPLSVALGSAHRTPLQLAWRTPTDVLLDTPGRELLRDIPSLGLTSLGALAGPAPRPGRTRPSADSTASRIATPRSPT